MYAYKGVKIGQGKENVKEYFKENPAVAEEIENVVRVKLGIIKTKEADVDKNNKKKKAE